MLQQLRTAPNQLTLLRLIIIPFIAISVVDGRFGWALGLFVAAGLSDGLDGYLARKMNQRTTLGQYLDPIADKLLLSTMFIVLSLTHKVPWRITILVFSRDLGMLLVSALLFLTASMRDFKPSILGKANTVAQLITVLLVMVDELSRNPWVTQAKVAGFWLTFVLTLVSWVHYTIVVGQRLRSTGGRSTEA